MAAFSFAEGAAMFDSTPIENLFLMEHLPAAPDKYLRVYLYARMLALHPELGDMAEMVQALRLDEDTVYNAFTYWEQRGLVRRLSDHPPTYELLPVRGEGLAAANPLEADYYVYRDFNAALQSMFDSKLIEDHEYRIANDWLNVLGYDQEAVLKLVAHGISTSRSKNPSPSGVFKRMNKLAAAWADRGCRTAEDVERMIAEDEGVYAVAKEVLKRFALRRDPTLDELECVRRWTREWHFTPDQILAACGETTKARTPTFAYLDAILKSRLDDRDDLWRELSEILKELDNPQAQPTPDQLERYAALRARGFESGAVKLAAIQCHEKKRTRFEDMERMLDKWGELGLYTRDAAETYIRDMSLKAARVRRILELCGQDRRVRLNDLALYENWKQLHDEAVIDYAAGCARNAKEPMQYMDKLLAQWAASGARTVEAARAEHEASRTAQSAPAAKNASANPALDYAQRKYTDEDYGDDFFFDVVKEYGNGGTQK